MNPDGSFKAGWNQILDGAATMLGNPPHARHTPTVIQINDSKESKNSGKDGGTSLALCHADQDTQPRYSGSCRGIE
jgi:hypothetical protein